MYVVLLEKFDMNDVYRDKFELQLFFMEKKMNKTRTDIYASIPL